MPGQTPNTTILKAIDEVINALNDLAANFQPSQPPDFTIIETNLEGVGDAVTALNTTIETRSIAETVAQNTNFDDLIAAIGQLSLVCAPEINVQSATPTINLSCAPPIINIQTGTPTGTKLEDPPVSETDPPPPGSEPDPNIDNRKCKAANLIYDKVHYASSEMDRLGVDFFQNIGVVASAGIIGFLLGGPIFGVLGVVVGIVSAFFAGADLGKIISAMDSRHDDLICALYNAANTTQARDDFLAILEEEGAIWEFGEKELQLISYFFVNDYLKVLFQAVPEINSEAILDGYAVSVDCSGCESCGLKRRPDLTTPYISWPSFEFGDMLPTYLTPNYWNNNDSYIIFVSFDQLYDVTLSASGLTPWESAPTTRAGDAVCADAGGQSNIYNSTSFLTDLVGVGNLTIASQTEFTLTITQT